jgi:hypothetical protein
MKTPTENLKGISIKAIVDTGDSTTAFRIMELTRKRGNSYRGTMKAVKAVAEAEGYTDFDPAAWDALVAEGEAASKQPDTGWQRNTK